MADNWNDCRQYTSADFTAKQLHEITNLLADKQVETTRRKNQTANIPEQYLGLSDANFIDLYNNLPSLHMAIKNKEKGKIALKMYLMRLRTGDFLYRIRDMLQLSEKTQRKYMNTARKHC